MGAVLLNFSDKLNFSDRGDISAEVILRELRAVLGAEIRADDIGAESRRMAEAIADNIVDSDILITVGGIDTESGEGVKDILTRGLGLESAVNEAALDSLEKYYRGLGEPVPKNAAKRATLPEIAKALPNPYGGSCPFLLASQEQLIICLPDSLSQLMPIMFRGVYPCLAAFADKELFFAERKAFGLEPQKIYRELDRMHLPLELEYNVSAYGRGQWLRLICDDENMLEEALGDIDFALLSMEPVAAAFAPFGGSGEDEPTEEIPLTKSEQKKEKRQRKKDRQTLLIPKKDDAPADILRKAIFALATVTLIASLSFLVYSMYGDYKNKQNNQEYSELYTSSTSPPEESSQVTVLPEGYIEKFTPLYEQNKDLVGFLAIEGTDISYPVVQSKDNEYYLRRDFKGKENQNGIPFVDYRVDMKNPPANTVIYGHNMRNGQMFEPLLQYRDLNFYKDHPVIKFDSVYEEQQYKVLAVFITNTREQDGKVFEYIHFIEGETEELMKFTKELEARSLIKTGVDVKEGDKLLTLSTCTYEFTEARFVVVGRKLREGESPDMNTENAVKNPNPLMPDVWYKLYGGKNPNAPASTSSEAKPVIAKPSSSAPSSKPSSSVPSSKPSSSKPSSSSKVPVEPIEPIEPPPEAVDPTPEDDLGVVLSVTAGGRVVEGDTYDIITQIVENEMRGNMDMEALKAQAVASYSYIRYNNSIGISPNVALRNPTSSIVNKAVSSVLGEACYYRGEFANTVYHSVSCGTTASSKSVWGTNLPYLVSVDSEYDSGAPAYGGEYSISEKSFADAVLRTYGIDLYDEGLPPEDWVYIDTGNMASGDYVGRVEIGGYDRSQGGSCGVGKAITGRTIREQLLNFNLRSTSFDVEFTGTHFKFITRGYGHGVGMSQWGAHYMAQNGASYVEILEHYFTGITVK